MVERVLGSARDAPASVVGPLKKARIPVLDAGPCASRLGVPPKPLPPGWRIFNGHAAPLEHGVPRVSSASRDREEADHPLSDLNRRVLDPGASTLKR